VAQQTEATAAQIAELMVDLRKSPVSAGAHALDALLDIAAQHPSAALAAQAGRIADCCSDLSAQLGRQAKA
jgi:hypothetical protein